MGCDEDGVDGRLRGKECVDAEEEGKRGEKTGKHGRSAGQRTLTEL